MSLAHLLASNSTPTNPEVVFTDGEQVRFLVESVSEDIARGFVRLGCAVCSGTQEGKRYDIRIYALKANGQTNPAFYHFMRAFFTDEELAKKKADLSTLKDRVFSAQCSVREVNSKRYQNFSYFKDEGYGDAEKAFDDIPF